MAESCVLFYQAGTSDKEYHLKLEQVGQGWNVTALYGRRGGSLSTASKLVNGLYEEALKSFTRVKKEKLAEGYREAANGAVASTAPVTAAALETSVEVELLTPIEIAEIGKYILDDRYWFQEKADGDRSPVRRAGDSFTRYNRKGEPKPLPSKVAAALAATLQTEWLLDGEIEGDQLWIFCALEARASSFRSPIGSDLRSMPFSERYSIAEAIMSRVSHPTVFLLPVAKTAAEKEAFVRQAIAANAEGVVIIDSQAAFQPGRAGQHFKLKFVTTATVRVRSHHKDGKRNVNIELFDGDPSLVERHLVSEGSWRNWQAFGSVSIPGKYGPLPAPGTLLEVRYLYAHRGELRGEQGGSLNQPVYLRRRDDLDPSAATVSQLKFKRGEDDQPKGNG
jgi:bifunctional non-homologous end joining protein LigD